MPFFRGLVVVAVAATACAQAAFGAEASVPPALEQYLRTRLPHLEVLDKRAATDEVLAALRPEGRDSAPFVCSGDFNGDGVPDVAAILRDRQTHKLSLMAFHGTRGGDYQPVIVADLSQILLEPGKKIDQYLVCEKPGVFREPNGRERRVTTDSIVRAFEGKAAILYYWNGTRYEHFVSSD